MTRDALDVLARLKDPQRRRAGKRLTPKTQQKTTGLGKNSLHYFDVHVG